MVLEIIEGMLRECGADVASAPDCDAAITLMAARKWDVLLTDLVFSERRSGLDLAEEAAVRGIHSVIMSGAADRREEVEARGVRFLAKPFTCTELLAAIALRDHPKSLSALRCPR